MNLIISVCFVGCCRRVRSFPGHQQVFGSLCAKVVFLSRPISVDIFNYFFKSTRKIFDRFLNGRGIFMWETKNNDHVSSFLSICFAYHACLLTLICDLHWLWTFELPIGFFPMKFKQKLIYNKLVQSSNEIKSWS